jgi:hypothetical protein
MTLATLIDPRFTAVLAKLRSCEKLPLTVGYRLHHIQEAVTKELSTYESLRMEAIKKFCSKKEDGSLDQDDKGNAIFSSENMEAFVQEINDLIKVDISIGKIKLEDLVGKVELSSEEISVAIGLFEHNLT